MVMERLSRTVRDRLLFLGRLRAATAASRATAILMISLPPAVLAFFTFREPDYLSNLLSSAWAETPRWPRSRWKSSAASGCCGF